MEDFERDGMVTNRDSHDSHNSDNTTHLAPSPLPCSTSLGHNLSMWPLCLYVGRRSNYHVNRGRFVFDAMLLSCMPSIKPSNHISE
jgi:hypothetical protein